MAWALVYTASTVIQAGIVEGFLKAHGIDATTLSAADTSRAVTVGSLAVVKVFVPSHDAIEAEHLLRAMENGEAGAGHLEEFASDDVNDVDDGDEENDDGAGSIA